MRVRVVDSRGVELHPCAAAKAQHLISRGKAVPRRDEQGDYYIQLTYVQKPNGHRRRPRKRQVVMQRSARQNGRSLPLKLNVGETQEEVLDVLALVESPYEVVVSGKLDQLVVVDLEATCWENDPPDGQESEIIEIGICTVDIRTGERLDRESVLVRPERSQVSLFCTQLTTLTQAQVDGGLSFAEACQHLRAQYQTRERVWASYGDYDRRLFQRQCLDRGVPYPFGHTHVNIKNLVALIQGLPREVGLVHAIGIMGLPLEGTHHRGVDDAWNAALLIATLIMQRRNDLNA